ncbi:iron-containing alcohol dehydrogenase [Alteromonas facilis]|uniref:iron-containing alcohol dehydrogenase n=1 Tax=Alteromonas facilis TaxID=2048004 RepID=UPI000C281814|nr:iron-containing alcohol dehydrogenase [Alteromonas facilis]
MNEFTFATTAKMILGKSVDQALLEYCQKHRFSRVMLVTDPGICGVGLLDKTKATLEEGNISLTIFDQVEADPSSQTVLTAVELGKQQSVEAVVGFGGGSSMDVAKLVALLAHPENQQNLDDIYGVDQIRGYRLPLVQVPTTAGTGSEVTPISIVTTGGTTKAGVVSDKLQPDLAILDPDLTLGLPPHITAATGIDAMVHAIEAYTSKLRKNPYSDMLARQALEILNSNIQQAVENGSNREARVNMLFGAMLAGQAFANAPVAGVHALAYPLGGHYHISHGLSNALVLPHVLRFNLSHAVTEYAELAKILCPDAIAGNSKEKAAMAMIEHVASLSKTLGLPTQLRECGVTENSLDTLAADAMLQQRLLINNPRPVELHDALTIYQQAF